MFKIFRFFAKISFAIFVSFAQFHLAFSSTNFLCGSVPLNTQYECKINFSNTGFQIFLSQPDSQPERTFSFSSTYFLETTFVSSHSISIFFFPSEQTFYFASITSASGDKFFVQGEGIDPQSAVFSEPSSSYLGKVLPGENLDVNLSFYNRSFFSPAFFKNSNFEGDFEFISFSCELTYIIPRDSTRCVLKFRVPYDLSRKGKVFSGMLKANFEIFSFPVSATFYFSGESAFPIPKYIEEIDFGVVRVGGLKNSLIEIWNDGNYELVITSVAVYSESFLVQISTPVSVFPSKKIFIPVYFYPVSADYFDSFSVFYSNAGTFTVRLKGRGIANPFPTISVQPRFVDFGYIFPSESSSVEVKIKNLGGENLIIKSINTSSPYFFTDNILFPIFLEPDESFSLNLYFRPDKEGDFEDKLVIVSSDPDQPRYELELLGKAYFPKLVLPRNLDLGYARVGREKKSYIFVANSGYFPFILSDVRTLEKQRYFSFSLTFSLPLTLNYSDSISIPIIFSPDSSTDFVSNFEFDFLFPRSSYSMSDLSQFELRRFFVSVSGKGGYPYLRLTRYEISAGEIWSDESKKLVFPLENTGFVPLQIYSIFVRSKSDIIKLSFSSVDIQPGQSIPLEIIISSVNSLEGEIRDEIVLISDDPLKPELSVPVRFYVKKPKEIWKGGGCYLTDITQFLLAYFIFFATFLFIRFLRKFFPLLFFSFLFLTFSFSYSLALNFHFFTPSYDEFNFVRTSSFLPQNSYRIYFSSFYVSSPLYRAVLKGDEEISSQKIINYAFPLFFGAVYSISPKINLYLSFPFSFLSSENSGNFSIGDIYFGGRANIFERENLSFSFDSFLSLPTGDDRRFFGSRPFSTSGIFILSLKNFHANFGLIYAGKNIPFTSLLSFGLRYGLTKTVFPVFELTSFFPFDFSYLRLGSELIGGIFLDFEDFSILFGAGKGFGESLGVPDFRFSFSARFNIFPSYQIENIRYFKVNLILEDEFGNRVSNCIVQVDKLFKTYRVKDGQSVLELPYGTWQAVALCEGFAMGRVWITENTKDVKIILQKSLPQIVVFSTDENGIPAEREIKLKFGEKSFSFDTHYLTAKGYEKYELEVGDTFYSVNVSYGKVLWYGAIVKEKELAEGNEENIQNEQDVQSQQEKFEGGKPTEGKKAMKFKEEKFRGKNFGPSEKYEENINLEEIARVRALDVYIDREGVIFKQVIDNFQLNSYTLPKDAYLKIEKVLSFVKSNIGKIKDIRIEGHTDDTGSYEWNMELSYRRADEVRKFLFSKGLVFPVKVIGFGMNFPVDVSRGGSPRNRRVEIKIIME
jgi:outer membrane protein OmpA-like peptidoglycan-associated protein